MKMTFEEAIKSVPTIEKYGSKNIYATKGGEWYLIVICNAADEKNWDSAWAYCRAGHRPCYKNSRNSFTEFYTTQEEAEKAAFIQRSIPIPSDWETVKIENSISSEKSEEWNGRDGESFGTHTVSTNYYKTLAIYSDGEDFELANAHEWGFSDVWSSGIPLLEDGEYAVESVEEDKKGEYFILHKINGGRCEQASVRVRIK